MHPGRVEIEACGIQISNGGDGKRQVPTKFEIIHDIQTIQSVKVDSLSTKLDHGI